MKLRAYQQEQLHAAICESFSIGELNRLASFTFGKDLDRIAASGELDDRVLRLIEWTEDRGLTTVLLARVCNERRGSRLTDDLLAAAVRWPACCEGGLTEHGGAAYCFADRSVEIACLTDQIARLKAQTAEYLPVPAILRGPGADEVRVDDAAAALKECVSALYPDPPPHPCDKDGRRALFLLAGGAGAGKTTVMRQAARLLAEAAKDNRRLPLPVCPAWDVGRGDVLSQIEASFGALKDSLWAYLAHGRAVLLLDSLGAANGASNDTAGEPAAQIKALFEKEEAFAAPLVAACGIDACAALDEFAPVTLTLAPLDLAAQGRFLRALLPAAGGEDRGGAALAKLAGGEASLAEAVRWEQPAPLLELYSTPHLLKRFAERHAQDVELPRFNVGRLTAEYVADVLAGERSRAELDEPDAAAVEAALGALAYAMRKEGRGDAAPRAWTPERLDADAPRAAALLDAAHRAQFVVPADGGVRFRTDLLADYFAAVGWRQAWNERREITASWPDGWWTANGWDAPAVLLTGLLDADAEPFVAALLPLNPALAARCIGESGAGPFEDALVNGVRGALTAAAESRDLPFRSRCAAGDALNHLGDLRRGVGVRRTDGAPDIDWRAVPEGAFAVSRYPITNAQFAAFVADGGYTAKRRACWSDEGWAWREGRRAEGPKHEGGVHDLPNHPVVWVSCHEAEAFCRWLSWKLRVHAALPTEAQWEAAASCADGRQYPHGDSLTPDDANYAAAGLCATSAVGVFPNGESPCGARDMAGNVWEWTADEAGGASGGENAQRAARGGSYDSSEVGVRCGSRTVRAAGGACDVGFRVVKVDGEIDEAMDE